MADVKEIQIGPNGTVYEIKDETARQSAGSGDGTVTGVKMNNGEPIGPDEDGIVDLGTVITSHQDVSGKANKNEMSVVDGTGANADKTTITLKEGMSTTVLKQHQDISNLATKTELAGKQATLVSGTNIKTINNTSVLGEGNISIPSGADGVTPHIGENGNWWIGPDTDPNNDTGKKAQGPAGESISDADLTIGNALNGQGDVLGMAGAMTVKANIDSLYTSLNRLYGKLANLAFWDSTDKAAAAPTALDWSVPKKTLTISNSNSYAKVMYNGGEVTSPIQVDMGTTVNLLVVGEDGYGISSVTASGSTIINNGDSTFTVSIKVDDTMTLTLSITTVALNTITCSLTNCSKTSGPSGVATGGGGTIVIAADSGYALPFSVQVSGATLDDYDRDTGEVVISNATGAVTITAVGFYATYTFLPMKFTSIDRWVKGMNNRSTLLMDDDYVATKNSWTTQSGQDTKTQDDYSMIPIPTGATSVSISVDSSYSLVYYLVKSNANGGNYGDPTWQGDSATVDLTDYPDAVYLAVNFKKTDNGNFDPNDTEDSLGLNLSLVFS